MKRIICTLLVAGCVVAANAKDDKTVILEVKKPSTVTIIEKPGGVMVDIVNQQDSTDKQQYTVVDYRDNKTVVTDMRKFTAFGVPNHYGRPVTPRWDVTCGGLFLGMVNSLNQPGEMNLRWAKSYEVGILNLIGVKYSYKYSSLSLGMGMDWRNYKMNTVNHRMELQPDGSMSLTPYPDGCTPRFSRIKVFGLGFPLLYTQGFRGSSVAITVGGIMNVNTHASLLTKYRNAQGKEIKENTNEIGRRKVTFDLYGDIKLYDSFGVYVRYSPQSVLQGAGLPEFNPLSVGFVIGI